MSANSGKRNKGVPNRHESHFGNHAKHLEIQRISQVGLGQSDPRHCPYPETSDHPLGTPIDIEDVAELLGCSPWTVRQKYLPQGLPHLRASASGRFVFFREQVIDWILDRQEKGGTK